MRYGVQAVLTGYGVDPRVLARAVEERGFDALLLTEHTHIPACRATPFPGGGELPRKYAHPLDPFVALASMAAVTERIALGTAVCLVAQHDPIVLAKTVASLDLISGGRVELGVGLGWNREELAHHGVDPRTRAARVRECVLAMRELWTRDEAEFHGEFVDFGPAWSWPKPVRVPPVALGGRHPAVLHRVAEYGDGWIPPRVPPADLGRFARQVAELRERVGAAGRGPLTVTVVGAEPEPPVLSAYAEAGVDRVAFELPDPVAAGDGGRDGRGTDAVLHLLDRLAGLTAEHTGGHR